MSYDVKFDWIPTVRNTNFSTSNKMNKKLSNHEKTYGLKLA
jgi:hypothetical protein